MQIDLRRFDLSKALDLAGVRFGRWTAVDRKAQISANGKRYYLGTFDALEDAVNARHYAEQIIHGEWSGEINRKDFEKIMGREEALRDEGA